MMSRDDARRAALLSDALEACPDLIVAIEAQYEPAHGYTQMLVGIGMHECDADPYNGGSGSERIYVDRATAAKIMAAASAIIVEELSALGVDASPSDKGQTE